MMTVSGFLGRALMDPATGLPNLPYFSIVRDWEERRARRRGYSVRVLTIAAECQDEALMRSLGWRLCQELRTSDLIASEGRSTFRVLLTSPDAEKAETIAERISAMGDALSAEHQDAALRLDAIVEPVGGHGGERGPCDPCDDTVLGGDGTP
jgi:GGDEF domain-containing protein